MPNDNLLFYYLADALRVHLSVDPAKSRRGITGNAGIDVEFFESGKFTLNVTIRDSYSRGASLVAALAHVRGDLYALAIVGGNSDEITLMLIDGAKLNWKQTKPIELFGPSWERKRVYETVCDGVVGVWVQLFGQDQWQPFGEGNEFVKHYLETRKTTALASGMVKERYRTIGPRGV